MTLSQLHHFFDNFILPPPPSEYNNPLGGEISNSEILQTIKSLKCSKTPGPDRHLLTYLTTGCYYTPAKSRYKSNPVCFYQPVSLLNIDYKILFKILRQVLF
uniref:Reverse transcriptase domain-containing protein n=1 Tax=Oreochromis niloticus TaxID=8128 RepID=A0A669D710_ORENI